MRPFARRLCSLLLLALSQLVLAQDDIFRDRVLPPWTPIRVEGANVHVWNRVYRLGSAPVPVSMTSAGAELLAGPISLEIVADSKALSWSGGHRVSEKPFRCVTRFDGEAGELKVEALTAIEFDGMLRVDLSLKPEGEVRVERMELRIPLRSEHGRLFTHNVIGTEAVASPRWTLRDRPEQQWWGGAVPEEGWRVPFTPQVWIGMEDRGLAWFSDTPAEWHPRNASNAIEIMRSGKSTGLIVRFIQEPVTIKGPTRYRFGLMATPVKPFDQKLANVRIASTAAGGPKEFQERFMTPGVWASPSVFACLRGDVTVSGWVWLAKAEGTQAVVGSKAVSLCYLGEKKEMVFSLMDSEGAVHALRHGIDLPAGRWVHLAATSGGNGVVLWIDGKKVAENEEAFEFRSTGEVPFQVGANGWGNRRWVGKLDEIAIVRKALGDSEVADLMKGSRPKPDDIAVYWDFEAEPDGLICTGAGPEHVALRFDPPKDGRNYAPKWIDGKIGKAIELTGDCATATDNPDGLTGFAYCERNGIDALVLWNFWSNIWGYPGITLPEKQQFLRGFLAEAHKHGIRILPYISIGIMMENEPEAGQMVNKVAQGRKPRFRRGKLRGYLIDKNLAWAKYYGDKLAQFAREFDVDGIYMDGAGLDATLDTALGDAKDGQKPAVKYSVFAGRELMRRCYAVFHGGVREEGLVFTHDSAPPLVMQDCFTDIHLNGELHYWLMRFRNLSRTHKAPLLERFPPALARAWFVGQVYGVPQAFCGKHRTKRYTDGKHGLLRGALLTDDEIIACLAIHGTPAWTCSPMWAWTGLDGPWWQARDHFGRDGTTWHPYWRKGQFVSAQPDMVKVSFFRREKDGAVLLIVGNLGDAPVEATVTLNPATLGGGVWRCIHVTPRLQEFELDGSRLNCRLPAGTAAYFELASR